MRRTIWLTMLCACGPQVGDADDVGDAASSSDADVSSSTALDDDTSSDTTASPCVGFEAEIVGDVVLDDASDLAALACLVRIDGTLTVDEQATLPTPLPFAALREVTGDLVITSNPTLETLAGLDALERVGKSGYISDNHARVGVAALASLREVHEFSLHDAPLLTELDMFADVVHFTGDGPSLGLGGLPAIETLDGLAHVTEVSSEHDLWISIFDNDTLVDISGISTFARGGTRASLELADLSGLRDVRLVDVAELSTLRIERAPALDSFAGLASLTSLGALALTDLPALSSLAGLDNVTTIGSVGFGRCLEDPPTGLTSMDGLGGLLRVESLAIVGEPSLASLAGLSSSAEIGSLTIAFNPMLPEADAQAYASSVMASSPLICGNLDGIPCDEREFPCPPID